MLPYTLSPSNSPTSPSEPVSPIDSHNHAPHRVPSSRRTRETGNTEFFSAVYLDSPMREHESSEYGMEYMTRPLQVRKRDANKSDSSRTFSSNQDPVSWSSSRCAELETADVSAQRSAAASVPTSPRSTVLFSTPSSPRAAIGRSDTMTSTSSSTIHPHHSISRIFLNASPICSTPLPEVSRDIDNPTTRVQPKPRPVRPVRSRRIVSTTSDYHLNLGSSGGLFDKHLPGPSPPNTGGSTPTRRSFIASQPRRVIRPKLPSSPLTPSRAPVKAAKLLGTTNVTIPQASIGRTSGKKKHFRPLPTQTLVDIERFLGEVPRRVKATPGMSRPGKTRRPVEGTGSDGICERNVRSGETVRHQGQDGHMWLNVEEEQEFAWLMLEPPLIISPLPRVIRDRTGKGLDGMEDGYEVVVQESEGVEGESDQWGMTNFQSVLTMPKPQKVGNKSKSHAPKSKTKKGFREIDESFMDFGDSKSTQKPQDIPRLVVPATFHPWASTDSLGIVTPSHADSSSDASPPVSPTDQHIVDSCFLPKRSVSPSRIKNRPPPLILRSGMKNPNLPVISTTPDTSLFSSTEYRDEHDISGVSPITPFVRPRPAPVPDIPVVPSLPHFITTTTIPVIPTIPTIPQIPHLQPMDMFDDDYRHDDAEYQDDLAFPGQYGPTGRPRPRKSKAARLMGLDPMEDPTMRNVSFFEPDSPTERYSRPGFSVSTAAGIRAGKGWLKKVVRPLVKV